MTHSYRLKPLTLQDARICAAIHQECFPEAPWDEGYFQTCMGDENFYGAGAFDDGDTLMGFILCQSCLDEAEILTLAVWQKSRNQGIGYALVEACIAYYKQRSIKSIFLEVAANNSAAQKIYNTLDFKEILRRKNYYTHSILPPQDALILKFSYIK